MLCEGCKCFGATKHTHLNITNREDCAVAAWDAGYKYYSWLRYGSELLCSYGTHANESIVHKREEATETEVCVTHKDTGLNRPWRIYQMDENTDNCDCQSVEVAVKEAGFKCRGFESIIQWKYRKRKVAKSAQHCGLYAYKEGHETFSYLDVGPPEDKTTQVDTRWCMFGHKISSEHACKKEASPHTTGAVKTKNPKWSIYSAVCNEQYNAFQISTCKAFAQTMVWNPATPTPNPNNAEAYTACCATDQSVGQATDKCKVQHNNACIGTEKVSYYAAKATCKGLGMRLCDNLLELTNCCPDGADLCGFKSKFYWSNELLNPMADEKTMP